jgi:hypothetical protein
LSANFPLSLLFLLIALFGAAIQLLIQRRGLTAQRMLEVLLLWLLVVPIGIGSIVGALAHMFIPDQVATSIGWGTGSPFQLENAFGDLGVGVLGVLCIWFRGSFWTATVIMASISLLGDAYGHIYQLVAHHDTAPNNSGVILYTDIIVPLLAILLLVAYHRLSEDEAELAGLRHETSS